MYLRIQKSHIFCTFLYPNQTLANQSPRHITKYLQSLLLFNNISQIILLKYIYIFILKHLILRKLPWSRGKPSDIHPTTVVFCYICRSNPGLGHIFYFRFRKDYGKTSLIKIASIINAVIWYFNRFSVTIQIKNLIFGKIRHSKSSGVLFINKILDCISTSTVFHFFI